MARVRPGIRRLRPKPYLAVCTVIFLIVSAPGIVAAQGSQEQAQAGGYKIDGNAIPLPLTAVPGDAARGRGIVASRQQGLCLLCHTGPIPEERFQGNLAPDLGGAGGRWSEGQLRLRMVDARRFNAATIMPSYYRTEDLVRVAGAWQGKPILSAQQIEDVVAFLLTLKGDGSNGSIKDGGK